MLPYWSGKTMRAIGNAISSFFNTDLQAPKPVYNVSYIARPRFSMYQIPHAKTPLEFAIQYRRDILDAKVTAALDDALASHIATKPIEERYVILHAGNWLGLFAIQENTVPTTLVLRLSDVDDDPNFVNTFMSLR